MRIVQCEQGSTAWYAARLGVATSSQFHRIITPGGKPSSQSTAYMYRLIAERLLNESSDDYLGNVQWMERGKLLEGDARAQFEFTHNVELEPVGFITDNSGRLGASPDSLLPGRIGTVEIKCPSPWTHLEYAIEGPGKDYRPQVQGQLLVGEFDRGVFYSYHPRCPPVEIVTYRDAAYQRVMMQLLVDFLEQMDECLARCRALGAYVVSQSLTTPMEHAFPESGPEPLQVIVPD